MAVQEEVGKIDTAPIDALLGIQSEQEQLKALLGKAESTKDKVSEAVYRRVRQDYDKRLEALEAKAQPLRDHARQEQARLRPLHERLRKALEDARLDLEELQFRREVGELKEEEFAGKRKALDEALAQREHEFKEADGLAQRFVSVVGAFVESAAGAPPVVAPSAAAPPAASPAASPAPAPGPAAGLEAEPPTAPRTKAAPVPVPMPSPPPPPPRYSGPVSPPTAALSRPDETLFAPPVPPPPASPPPVPPPPVPPVPLPTTEIPVLREEPVEGTVVMSFATLTSVDATPSQEYRLGARTSIGRVKDNEICIPVPSISRRHAVVALTADGYVITDLESGNGTFVNEDRVQMQKLKDGDRVRLGDRAFLFRGPPGS